MMIAHMETCQRMSVIHRDVELRFFVSERRFKFRRQRYHSDARFQRETLGGEPQNQSNDCCATIVRISDNLQFWQRRSVIVSWASQTGMLLARRWLIKRPRLRATGQKERRVGENAPWRPVRHAGQRDAPAGGWAASYVLCPRSLHGFCKWVKFPVLYLCRST